MKVTRLLVHNYRAFASPQVLDLRPLTLIYGYNHAGKSALVRALPLLADSSTGLYPAPLALDSRAVRDAAFDDLRCRAQPDLPVAFGLLAEHGDGARSTWFAQIDELSRPRRQYVAAWTFTREGGGEPGEIAATWDRSGGLPGERVGTYRIAGFEPSLVQLRFEGLVPYLDKAPASVESLLDDARALLRGLRGQLQWLGAVRGQPRRRERTTGAPPLLMQPDGSNAAHMLAANLEEGGDLVQRIAAFYLGGDGSGFRFWAEPEADFVRLKLAPKAAPTMWTDLLDAGEGMVQVLPVLVALARAARGRTDDARLVVLEQPELHLHPRMEARLGEHLCETASLEDPPTVLVETHSEALLLAIQRALLQGRLPPDRVAVYWVRQIPEGESVVERVQIDDQGRLDEVWPPGTFQEAVNLARDVVKLRMARARG